MSEIRGLRTVNCGEIVTLNNVEDPLRNGEPLIVEVLRPENHNPTHQIVCYYYINKEIGSKVEVTLAKNITNNTLSSEVYFFKGNDIQHYRSKYYADIKNVPLKYFKILDQLAKAMKILF
jgi:hypothetical protein